ncbi:MAG TPA: hypothetical protein VFB06_11395 [Streptosporangiaceae bacterium]|nr:hypothetical protein [Streptosporangiaceae bacterium]
MPPYRFTGLTPMTYPESRDEHGIPVGTAEPGDVRDTDGPLDWLWVPAEENRDGPAAASRPVKRRSTAADTAPGDQETGAQAGSSDAGQPGSKES